MLFNSYEFLFLFLPLALVVCLPRRGRALLRSLTLLSFLFYAFAGEAWYLLPMLFTAGLDFLLAPRMHAAAGSRRRAILWTSLSLNLGLLGWFKYAGLLFGPAYAHEVPPGISFYTFQTLAYMIDVYRGEAEPETSWWRFAGFVSFFPHLVAGPLTRHNQLLPGLKRIEKEGIRPDFEAAAFLFGAGLVKKVLLGDVLAREVDRLLSGGGPHGAAAAWASLLGFSLQIYFDFSGYTDMALGLGRLFGITLPANFNNPYASAGPREFWHRWHITLSRFLRDYLYFGLGGNRRGQRRQDFNLVVTMFLGGLWHGAQWTFAAWGLYHGALLMGQRRLGGREEAWPRPLRVALTFLLVTLGWTFFRADSFPMAAQWWRALAGMVPAGAEPGVGAFYLALGALGLAAAVFVPEPEQLLERHGRRLWVWGLLGALAAWAFINMAQSSRFLYFQF
jgi:alginate O-acetyltransferase complex protein AlgI